MVSSRRGLVGGPIDGACDRLRLKREIATVVGGFSEALALARASDLIASVPERYTGNLRDGMFSFPLPIALPEITVSLLWHPRLDADPAHRWLRGCRSEEHTSELQSLMRISYAVFCLKKK